jgi:hypothetical protein
MARKTANKVLKHTVLKCQVRLAAARKGVRVQITAAPDTPGFAGVKIWPEQGDADRTITLKGGVSAVTSFELAPTEDFWVEISYGTGKKEGVQIKYKRKTPFGYKAAKVINPAKVDLIGSVPRIRP